MCCIDTLCALQCSSTCAGGFQRRVVVCQDADGRSNSYCDERVKPAESKSCDSGPCPLWNYGVWGEVRLYLEFEAQFLSNSSTQCEPYYISHKSCVSSFTHCLLCLSLSVCLFLSYHLQYKKQAFVQSQCERTIRWGSTKHKCPTAAHYTKHYYIIHCDYITY